MIIILQYIPNSNVNNNKYLVNVTHVDMVSAIQGVCITCDPQLKEILKAINAAKEPEERFLISDLSSDTNHRLFIKADSLERVKDEVKKYSEALHFDVDKQH